MRPKPLMPIFMDWEAEAPADGETIDQLRLIDRVFRVTSSSPRRCRFSKAAPFADRLVPAAPVQSLVEATAAPASPAEPLAPDQAQQLLRALAEPIRLQVVQALQHGERCVCDLTGDLNLAQSKLSFHLKVLKDAGFPVQAHVLSNLGHNIDQRGIDLAGALLRKVAD